MAGARKKASLESGGLSLSCLITVCLVYHSRLLPASASGLLCDLRAPLRGELARPCFPSLESTEPSELDGSGVLLGLLALELPLARGLAYDGRGKCIHVPPTLA